MQCYLDEKPLEVLWSPGLHCVRRFSEEPAIICQIQDVEQLLGSNGSLSLQAVNGTDIP